MVDQRSGLQWENAVRSGTRWVLASQLTSQAIGLLVLAVLYRSVPPDQYGLLGMVMPALLLAKIFSSFGLNVATVQRRSLTDGELSRVFWIGMLVSAGVAVVLAACGPLLARLYGAEVLWPLTATLAGTLVVTAAGAQHQALLERRMKLGRVSIARVIAQLSGAAAAIPLALTGAGVWALVAQQYAELTVLALLLWGMEPWRPRGGWGREGVGTWLRFGGYYSLSSLMFFVAQNADKVLVALLLGSSRSGQAALGMYSQAFNLMMKPVFLVTTPVTAIMLPTLSRVAHQPDEFLRFVIRFYRMVALVLFPAGIGLTIVAEDVMLVMGGDAWHPAGYLLMLLAPTIVAQGLLSVAGSVFAAGGRAGRLAAGAVVTAITVTGGCLLGWTVGSQWQTAPWGPVWGVAASYSFVTLVVLVIPYLVFCFRNVGLPAAQVLVPLVKPLAAAAIMGGAVACLRWGITLTAAAAPWRLISCVLLGSALYAALVRRDLKWLVDQLRDLRGEQPPKIDAGDRMV